MLPPLNAMVTRMPLTGRNPTGDVSGSLTALEIKNKESSVLLDQSPEPEEATRFLVYSGVGDVGGGTI